MTNNPSLRGKIVGMAESILFAGNILLLFLLLFESHLAIPLWLQPLGRMHPMMLHFPIALILLALMLEALRFRPEFRNQAIFQGLTRYILLFSILTGLLSAIMGLFLSQEEGYSGQMLDWHKWTGVGVVFLASLLYAFRNHGWYQGKAAKTGIGLVAITLVFAGHLGATLTHG